MKLVHKTISVDELKKMAAKMIREIVKAVVDIEEEIMMVDAPMHADLEEVMLEQGSSQENLWGINLQPHKQGRDVVEFDSMINIRPSQGNRTRGVDDPRLREKIITIVERIVQR